MTERKVCWLDLVSGCRHFNVICCTCSCHLCGLPRHTHFTTDVLHVLVIGSSIGRGQMHAAAAAVASSSGPQQQRGHAGQSVGGAAAAGTSPQDVALPEAGSRPSSLPADSGSGGRDLWRRSPHTAAAPVQRLSWGSRDCQVLCCLRLQYTELC